jgi:hypothetical protein
MDKYEDYDTWDDYPFPTYIDRCEDYDTWDDYTFLTYLEDCGFRYSQNRDCSKFTLLKSFCRGEIGDNWYYSLTFNIDNNLKINYIVEYNDRRTDNRYTYEYLNKIIVPSIDEFIGKFGTFDKNKINTFIINLIINLNI